MDALSRLISTKRNSESLDPIILKIEKKIGVAKKIAIDQLPITKNEIERETRYDEELKTIIKALKTEVWPKSTPHASINNFQSLFKELSIQNGILFMRARAVIPKILQNCVLKILHDGHPGISKMKMRARETVYWQGINKNIEEKVESFYSCQMPGKEPIKNKLCPWPMTKNAWNRFQIDFADPIEGFN